MASVPEKAISGYGRSLVYHRLPVRETILFLFPALMGLSKRPLLFVGIGFASGIFLSHLSLSLGLVFTLSLLLFWALRLPFRRWIPWCIAGAMGWALASPWTPPLALLSFPETKVSIKGVVTRVEMRPGGMRVLLSDITTVPADLLAPPQDSLRLLVKGDAALTEGETLVVHAALRPFQTFRNPGAFDYAAHMRNEGVGAWAVVKAKDLTTAPPSAKESWRAVRHRFRRQIETKFFATAPTQRAGALLTALILGDRSHLTQPMRDAFAKTGTAHLLAISGLHLGIVATLFYGLLTRLLSLWERLLIKGRVQRLAALLTLIPLFLYALLSGMAPSTQRALVAATLFLLTLALHEEVDIPTTLGLAATLILMAHPPALFSLSFQLSFSAVVAIVAGLYHARLLPQGNLTPPNRRWADRIRLFAVPPTCAWLGTAPLIWFHFGYVAPAGLAANLLIVPLASLLLIPMALLGTFAAPMVSPLAQLLFWGSGLLSEFLLILVDLFHAIPGAAITLPLPSPETVTALMVGIFSLLLAPKKQFKGPLVIAAVCAIFLCATGLRAIHSRFFAPHLAITVLDVGQGSACVISFPGKRRWLVDGGFARPGGFDTGRFAVMPYLQSQGILTLDAVVLSHPESDHMGGLVHIFNELNVRTLIRSHHDGKGKLWETFMEAVERSGARQILIHENTPDWRVAQTRIACLNPSSGPSMYKGRGATNNNSLVLALTHGNQTCLLTGDILKQAEKRLVETHGDALGADLLMVPHHGSKSSSTLPFLTKVAPRLAAISVGKNRRYNLPSEDVVSRYAHPHCQLFQTHKNGAITFTIHKDAITFETFAQDP